MSFMGIGSHCTHTSRNAGRSAPEVLHMSHHWKDQRRAERSEHRRSRRRGELTEEQRLYRQASRRAALKLSFVTHFVTYAAVVVMLLFVAGFRPAFYTAFGWGIFVVLHYFGALVAPGLRRRFIAKEVSRQVERNASRERHDLEDQHARSLEQLSASIAHEIRNPITAAKSLVQQMGEDPSSRENVEYAGIALEELDRVERSISHLLRFARDEEIRVADLSLAEVADSALETFRDRLTRLGVTVDRSIDSECWMEGDAEKVRRVLINLIGNALDAMEGAHVRAPHLTLSAGENLARTGVWLRLRDNGPGIPEDAQGRIFSPFFTSKPAGNGLGLAISKKVVDAHGGAIEVDSKPGQGCEFTVTFPKRAGGRAPAR